MVELTFAGWEGRGAAAGERLRQHVAGAQADAARAGKRRPHAGSVPGKFLKLYRGCGWRGLIALPHNELLCCVRVGGSSTVFLLI